MLLAALATAKRALPLYSHRHSPKKFTQHQLFACLVLKNFLKTDYRGLVAAPGGSFERLRKNPHLLSRQARFRAWPLWPPETAGDALLFRNRNIVFRNL